jgi:hypothetical protein
MAARASMDQNGISCISRIVVEEDIAAGRLIVPLESFGRFTGAFLPAVPSRARWLTGSHGVSQLALRRLAAC